MGGRPLRIYLPMLWFSLRPTDLYQVIKSSYCLAKTFERENCNLFRRCVDFRQVDKGSHAGEGYIDFSIAMGFVLNLEKSQFQPVKTLEFLGLNIDTQTMKISLTEEKVKRVITLCKRAKRTKKVSILSLTKLIGTLSSTVQAVMPAHLQFRYLQQDQIRALKKQGSYRSKLKLGRLSKLE